MCSEMSGPPQPADDQGRSAPTLTDVVARAQSLVDAARPGGAQSLAWRVQAEQLGDLQAISLLGLRSPQAI